MLEGDLSCGELASGDGTAGLLVEGLLAVQAEPGGRIGTVQLAVSTHQLRHVFADFRGVLTMHLDEKETPDSHGAATLAPTQCSWSVICGSVRLEEPEGYDAEYYIADGSMSASAVLAAGTPADNAAASCSLLEWDFVRWRRSVESKGLTVLNLCAAQPSCLLFACFGLCQVGWRGDDDDRLPAAVRQLLLDQMLKGHEHG
eukprot:SAG31_NODE_5814_length_2312_cov_2.350203_2_plen_201_part_00